MAKQQGEYQQMEEKYRATAQHTLQLIDEVK